MSEFLLPGDHVRVLATGEELYVNSSNYMCTKTKNVTRQMFSAVGRGPNKDGVRPLYYADECELIHRHEFEPFHGSSRCACGLVISTPLDLLRDYFAVKDQKDALQ